MFISINFWMCFAGLIFFAVGLSLSWKEIIASRGLDKLIALRFIFVAVPLAVFAPEHFGGPMDVPNQIPPWIPAHLFFAYLVGGALLASATSFTAKKFVRLSSTMLALMFFLFVCLMHIPHALANPGNRFAWAYTLRDLVFAGGAWALAGAQGRASSPHRSKLMIAFGRIVIGLSAVVFAAEHFLHPTYAPGFPLEMMTPSWFPLPKVWGFTTGAILLSAGLGLTLNRKPRLAATSIGALMTFLNLFFYMPILIHALNAPLLDFNDAFNNVADTMLFAGTTLCLASAMPTPDKRAEKRRSRPAKGAAIKSRESIIF